VFASFGGASVGVQAGIESSDVVLVFRSRRSLDRVLEGKVKLTLGADAAIAAGPIGREIEAATDARLEAEILCYTHTRGLFAGVSLDGGTIHPDPKTNAAFRKGARAEDERALNALKGRLVAMSSIGGPPNLPPGPPAPLVVLPGPPAPLPPPPPPVRTRPRWFSTR
jgi:lipid-binding SYLF domain-containing protein